MLKTYDSTAAAYTEQNTPEYYDKTAAAWAEVPSAKTYDTATAAWVEHIDRYHYFTMPAYSYDSGAGGYIVNDNDQTATFYFEQGSLGVDHAMIELVCDEPVTDPVFMSSYYTSDANINAIVYFYYQGQVVHQENILANATGVAIGVFYGDGPVDTVRINFAPWTPCTFKLERPWFGKNIKFNF